jgi:hypothetical protein
MSDADEKHRVSNQITGVFAASRPRPPLHPAPWHLD